MKRPISGTFIVIALLSCFVACSVQEKKPAMASKITEYQSSKPYTRWWWFASKFTHQDILEQLKWIKDNNFGGVEIAFIYPVNRNPNAERFEWLGAEWQDRVTFAKTCCDSLDLGCDFTFGTLWPFGGTFVSDADRTKNGATALLCSHCDFRGPCPILEMYLTTWIRARLIVMRR